MAETIFEIMKAALESGEDVHISRFGKFSVKNKDKRKTRNFATGREMVIDGRRVVTFKWSGCLKRSLNGRRKA